MVRELLLAGGLVALVDDEDYEQVSAYTWSPSRRKHRAYVAATIDGKRVYLHQFLLRPGEHLTGDHRDGDGLNNRRSNLRIATYSQNGANRAAPARNGYRGITRFKGYGWQAGLKFQRRFYHLGVYDDPAQAALAYDEKAREVFGEFARLNFPRLGERYNDGTVAGDDAPPVPERVDQTKPRLSGYRLWAERRRIGLSRQGLADRLGVHVNGVTEFEHGKRLSRPATIKRIATALGVDESAITVRDGDALTRAPIRRWQRRTTDAPPRPTPPPVPKGRPR